MPTKSAFQALSILRDPSQFQWYVIIFFLIVLYIYFVEVSKKNWSRVFAGLALWGMDWFNEIWNALFFILQIMHLFGERLQKQPI